MAVPWSAVAAATGTVLHPLAFSEHLGARRLRGGTPLVAGPPSPTAPRADCEIRRCTEPLIEEVLDELALESFHVVPTDDLTLHGTGSTPPPLSHGPDGW